MQSKKDKRSEGSGLGYLLVAGIGLVAGFVANEIFSKKPEPKTQDKESPVPINQSVQNNSQNKENNTGTSEDPECNDIVCPITLEIMTDPVISKKCGHSYEREAITQWLTKHTTCPKCHSEITKNDLITNYSLKNTIEYMRNYQKN